jgi:hypothetical protein
VAHVTDTHPVDHRAGVPRVVPPRRISDRRRAALANLRRLAVQLDAAAALERRADRSTNPALAALLRERADERRRIAEVVRAHLAEEGAELSNATYLLLFRIHP